MAFAISRHLVRPAFAQSRRSLTSLARSSRRPYVASSLLLDAVKYTKLTSNTSHFSSVSETPATFSAASPSVSDESSSISESEGKDKAVENLDDGEDDGSLARTKGEEESALSGASEELPVFEKRARYTSAKETPLETQKDYGLNSVAVVELSYEDVKEKMMEYSQDSQLFLSVEAYLATASFDDISKLAADVGPKVDDLMNTQHGPFLILNIMSKGDRQIVGDLMPRVCYNFGHVFDAENSLAVSNFFLQLASLKLPAPISSKSILAEKALLNFDRLWTGNSTQFNLMRAALARPHIMYANKERLLETMMENDDIIPSMLNARSGHGFITICESITLRQGSFMSPMKESYFFKKLGMFMEKFLTIAAHENNYPEPSQYYDERVMNVVKDFAEATPLVVIEDVLNFIQKSDLDREKLAPYEQIMLDNVEPEFKNAYLKRDGQ